MPVYGNFSKFVVPKGRLRDHRFSGNPEGMRALQLRQLTRKKLLEKQRFQLGHPLFEEVQRSGDRR